MSALSIKRKRSQVNARVTLLLLISGLSAFLLNSCNPGREEAVVFTNVNLVPMTSETVIENQAVLVEGSLIVVISDTNAVQIPPGAQVIDGQGAYLMPGLADMHMHTRADWEDREIWPVHPLRLYLANGVTAIRDFAPHGSPLAYALQWRDEIRSGARSGPAIYASGKLLYASPLEDPQGIVRDNYELGFDFIKLYSYLSREDFQAALTAAQELNLYTSGHIPYAVGLEGALAGGMDEIAHVEELLFEFVEFDRQAQLAPEEWLPSIAEAMLLQYDLSSSTLQADFEVEHAETRARIAAQLRAAQVPVCTTMVLDQVIQLKLFQPDTFLGRPENRYFERGYLESFQRGEEKHQIQCRGIERLCAFKAGIDRWVLRGLHDAGVLLLLGTDSGTGGMGIIPGYSVHDELQVLVENGLTPYEAITTGTINAALVVQRMTGQGNFGAVEVGKRADLILVKENPLEEISTIKAPLGVMAAGRWYSSEQLSELTRISE